MPAEDEFSALVRVQGRGLQRSAWLLTGDWFAAQDLVQIALLETWRHWDRLVRRDAPEVYARRVMLTTFLRSRRRRWTSEISMDSIPEPQAVPSVDETTEDRVQLSQALASLPPRQRAAIVLRYFVDLTEVQAADTMGCSVGAVKSHSAKAFAALRKSTHLSELLREDVR